MTKEERDKRINQLTADYRAGHITEVERVRRTAEVNAYYRALGGK